MAARFYDSIAPCCAVALVFFLLLLVTAVPSTATSPSDKCGLPQNFVSYVDAQGILAAPQDIVNTQNIVQCRPAIRQEVPLPPPSASGIGGLQIYSLTDVPRGSQSDISLNCPKNSALAYLSVGRDSYSYACYYVPGFSVDPVRTQTVTLRRRGTTTKRLATFEFIVGIRVNYQTSVTLTIVKLACLQPTYQYPGFPRYTVCDNGNADCRTVYGQNSSVGDLVTGSISEGFPAEVTCYPGTAVANNTACRYYCLGGGFTSERGCTQAASEVECIECPVGHMCPNQTERYASIPCVELTPRQYQSQAGQTHCNHCMPGMYSEDGIHALPCPPGSYCPGVGCNRHVCPVGSHQPSPQRSECLPCPAGSYSNHTNSTECVTCPLDLAQPLEGQSECIACPSSVHKCSTSLSGVCVNDFNTCSHGCQQNLLETPVCWDAAADSVHNVTLRKSFVDLLHDDGSSFRAIKVIDNHDISDASFPPQLLLRAVASSAVAVSPEVGTISLSVPQGDTGVITFLATFTEPTIDDTPSDLPEPQSTISTFSASLFLKLPSSNEYLRLKDAPVVYEPSSRVNTLNLTAVIPPHIDGVAQIVVSLSLRARNATAIDFFNWQDAALYRFFVTSAIMSLSLSSGQDPVTAFLLEAPNGGAVCPNDVFIATETESSTGIFRFDLPSLGDRFSYCREAQLTSTCLHISTKSGLRILDISIDNGRTVEMKVARDEFPLSVAYSVAESQSSSSNSGNSSENATSNCTVTVQAHNGINNIVEALDPITLSQEQLDERNPFGNTELSGSALTTPWHVIGSSSSYQEVPITFRPERAGYQLNITSPGSLSFFIQFSAEEDAAIFASQLDSLVAARVSFSDCGQVPVVIQASYLGQDGFLVKGISEPLQVSHCRSPEIVLTLVFPEFMLHEESDYYPSPYNSVSLSGFSSGSLTLSTAAPRVIVSPDLVLNGLILSPDSPHASLNLSLFTCESSAERCDLTFSINGEELPRASLQVTVPVEKTTVYPYAEIKVTASDGQQTSVKRVNLRLADVTLPRLRRNETTLTLPQSIGCQENATAINRFVHANAWDVVKKTLVEDNDYNFVNGSVGFLSEITSQGNYRVTVMMHDSSGVGVSENITLHVISSPCLLASNSSSLQRTITGLAAAFVVALLVVIAVSIYVVRLHNLLRTKSNVTLEITGGSAHVKEGEGQHDVRSLDAMLQLCTKQSSSQTATLSFEFSAAVYDWAEERVPSPGPVAFHQLPDFGVSDREVWARSVKGVTTLPAYACIYGQKGWLNSDLVAMYAAQEGEVNAGREGAVERVNNLNARAPSPPPLFPPDDEVLDMHDVEQEAKQPTNVLGALLEQEVEFKGHTRGGMLDVEMVPRTWRNRVLDLTYPFCRSVQDLVTCKRCRGNNGGGGGGDDDDDDDYNIRLLVVHFFTPDFVVPTLNAFVFRKQGVMQLSNLLLNREKCVAKMVEMMTQRIKALSSKLSISAADLAYWEQNKLQQVMHAAYHTEEREHCSSDCGCEVGKVGKAHVINSTYFTQTRDTYFVQMTLFFVDVLSQMLEALIFAHDLSKGYVIQGREQNLGFAVINLLMANVGMLEGTDCYKIRSLQHAVCFGTSEQQRDTTDVLVRGEELATVYPLGSLPIALTKDKGVVRAMDGEALDLYFFSLLMMQLFSLGSANAEWIFYETLAADFKNGTLPNPTDELDPSRHHLSSFIPAQLKRIADGCFVNCVTAKQALAKLRSETAAIEEDLDNRLYSLVTNLPIKKVPVHEKNEALEQKIKPLIRDAFDMVYLDDEGDNGGVDAAYRHDSGRNTLLSSGVSEPSIIVTGMSLQDDSSSDDSNLDGSSDDGGYLEIEAGHPPPDMHPLDGQGVNPFFDELHFPGQC